MKLIDKSSNNDGKGWKTIIDRLICVTRVKFVHLRGRINENAKKVF